MRTEIRNNLLNIIMAETNVKKPTTTYKLPAKPAALFCITVGSGGLHIMINS